VTITQGNRYMNIERSPHGYSLVHFIDAVGSDCSLQDSSLASEACCWFGVCRSPAPRRDEMTRMHLTVEMTRQVARAMRAALEGVPFENAEFVDRYGSTCIVAASKDARAVIRIGVTKGFHGNNGMPMHLDADGIRRLMPFLLGFLAGGSVSEKGGASELEDPAARVLDAKIPVSMLARADIGETGVSAQDLIDAFVLMERYYGDDLVGALGHDNAMRIGQMRTKLGHLAKR